MDYSLTVFNCLFFPRVSGCFSFFLKRGGGMEELQAFIIASYLSCLPFNSIVSYREFRFLLEISRSIFLLSCFSITEFLACYNVQGIPLFFNLETIIPGFYIFFSVFPNVQISSETLSSSPMVFLSVRERDMFSLTLWPL